MFTVNRDIIIGFSAFRVFVCLSVPVQLTAWKDSFPQFDQTVQKSLLLHGLTKFRRRIFPDSQWHWYWQTKNTKRRKTKYNIPVYSKHRHENKNTSPNSR